MCIAHICVYLWVCNWRWLWIVRSSTADKSVNASPLLLLSPVDLAVISKADTCIMRVARPNDQKYCLSVQQELGGKDLNPTAVPAVTTEAGPEMDSCHNNLYWGATASCPNGLIDTLLARSLSSWTLSKRPLPSFFQNKVTFLVTLINPSWCKRKD